MTGSSTPSGSPAAIDCATAVRRLWDYLDGRLTPIAHDEVEAHLATCQKCPPHFVFAERMKRSLAGATTPAMSSDDEARLRARIRGALAGMASDDDRRVE
jgi:anti-sigma factor RsiW